MERWRLVPTSRLYPLLHLLDVGGSVGLGLNLLVSVDERRMICRVGYFQVNGESQVQHVLLVLRKPRSPSFSRSGGDQAGYRRIRSGVGQSGRYARRIQV